MRILREVYIWVWGMPTLLLILGAGLFFSFRTGFAQLRLLPKALKGFFGGMEHGKRDNGVSSFQALCTALAATVGTGNLAGVAGAIAIGGPGSIFWMWVCGLLGMVIKFAEATLAVHFRTQNGEGEWVGGPMYMIRLGLPKSLHPLAGIYAFFGVIAAFGVGNATQVNTLMVGITDALAVFAIPIGWPITLLLAIALAMLIGFLLLGGAGRIGRMAEGLVPFAAGVYILLGLTVLVLRSQYIAEAFASIFRGAYNPAAVTGGVIGSLPMVLRTGISRGIFTNEAGMGTASIAHASASVSHPVQQGMMGIVEVFLDTIVICTITALVILVSDVPIPYGTDVGVSLTTRAFSAVLGEWVSVVIAVSLCLFALATILGWGLYGIRCAQYLFGQQVWKRFVFLQLIVVILSAMLKVELIWLLAEIVNGLMAIPNLIALLALAPELIKLYKSYLHGGIYEDFH